MAGWGGKLCKAAITMDRNGHEGLLSAIPESIRGVDSGFAYFSMGGFAADPSFRSCKWTPEGERLLVAPFSMS